MHFFSLFLDVGDKAGFYFHVPSGPVRHQQPGDGRASSDADLEVASWLPAGEDISDLMRRARDCVSGHEIDVSINEREFA